LFVADIDGIKVVTESTANHSESSCLVIVKKLRKFHLLVFFVLLSSLVVGVYFWSERWSLTERTLPKSPGTVAFVAPTSFTALLALKPQELAKVDVASMNLLCAQGLPGSEDLNLVVSLETLDQWAKQGGRYGDAAS
jgi:hypothetical protein